MFSDATRKRSEEITEARKYLLFQDLAFPAFTIFLAVIFTLCVALTNFKLITFFGLIMILELGLSIFLFALMPSSRLLLTQACFQLLDIVPKNDLAHSQTAEHYLERKDSVVRWSQGRLLSFTLIADLLLCVDLFILYFVLHIPYDWSIIPPFVPSSLIWVFFVASAVFLISCVVFFLTLLDIQRKSDRFFKSVVEENLRPYVASAVGLLRIQTRVGDTHNVVLDFDFSDTFTDYCAQSQVNRHLEVELQAAGLQVDGEKRVRLCPSSPLRHRLELLLCFCR